MVRPNSNGWWEPLQLFAMASACNPQALDTALGPEFLPVAEQSHLPDRAGSRDRQRLFDQRVAGEVGGVPWSIAGGLWDGGEGRRVG